MLARWFSAAPRSPPPQHRHYPRDSHVAADSAPSERARIVASCGRPITPELQALHRIHREISLDKWKGEDVEQCMNLRLIPNGSRVLEVGANIGRSTIMIAQHAGSVDSHEASPWDYRQLERHTARYRQKVRLRPAISDVPLYRTGAWDFGPVPNGYTDPGFGRDQRVPTTPLATVLARQYDVVVADCEGCFHALVAKTKGALLRPPVHTLIYEDDAHALEARGGLIAELRRQGFERIACFPLRRDMPWLVGRKLDDCFYVAWHRTTVQ